MKLAGPILAYGLAGFWLFLLVYPRWGRQYGRFADLRRMNGLAWLVGGPTAGLFLAWGFDSLGRYVLGPVLFYYGIFRGAYLLLTGGPVRVLYLRAFRSKSAEEIAPLVVKACRYIGRTEALCHPEEAPHKPGTFGLRAKEEAWRNTVAELSRKARLIVIDVTVITDSVRWELEHCVQTVSVPTILIAHESATADLECAEDVFRYSLPPTPEFVETFVKYLARKAGRRT